MYVCMNTNIEKYITFIQRKIRIWLIVFEMEMLKTRLEGDDNIWIYVKGGREFHFFIGKIPIFLYSDRHTDI